ncbi:MAG TPA: sugar phosphate isomerase/epimerase family protein [Cyclobacteriaceae bacterium]
MKRRNVLKTVAAATGLSLAGALPVSATPARRKDQKFKLCLNTSTISGQRLGVEKYIDITARAGYDAIEVWIGDLRAYMNEGKSLAALKKLASDAGVEIVNAIGFAQWMADEDEKRKAGVAQLKEEMEIMAALGCTRIAAPAAGVTSPPDLYKAGERYKVILELGRQTGVTPQLEVWGASPFSHLGQALMVAAVANDPDAHILADVYHLHRGNSGFDCMKLLDGKAVDIFHMNDYPASIPREQLQDKDRIYPGDGVAPLKVVLTHLKNMTGPKILSLELFNRDYWQQDPLTVAKTGLEKMRRVVAEV